jgi:FAD/FMN-containing dehydrogenase
VFNVIGMWDAGEPRDEHVRWVRSTWEALQLVGAGDPYLNFLANETDDEVRTAYGGETYDRLVKLKNRYDPSNTFRLNQNITPSH